jgi:cytochrome b561
MGYLLLAFVAVMGFAASLGCHVMGWLGIEPPFEDVSTILHVGLFVVVVPLVYFSSKTMPATADKKNNLKHLFAELPKWIEKTLPYLAAYLVFNFVFATYSIEQYPKNREPPYLTIRLFSGHWMLFYGMSALGFVGLFRLSRKKKATESDATPPEQ